MNPRKQDYQPRARSTGETAQPILHQRARETQDFDAVTPELPLALPAEARREMARQLNQILADTMTLRDLYKKSHWQVSGPTFYQLHLLYGKHYKEQDELVDSLAERIQTLGGISVAMAHDVAEMTSIARPPRGWEEVPVQLSRLLEAMRPLSRKSVPAPGGQTNWRTTAQTTCWSAKCCAPMSCRYGFCPNTWWKCR